METYVKTVAVEGRVLEDIARAVVLPAASRAESEAAKLAMRIAALCDAKDSPEHERFTEVRRHVLGLTKNLGELEAALRGLNAIKETFAQAHHARDVLLPAMLAVRSECDALERMIDREAWPLPTYAEMMWMH